MRYAISFTVLLALAVGMVLAQAQKPNQDANTNGGGTVALTISVKDFGSRNVIGHLGYPLGTIVRVTGKVIDGDTTGMKRNAGKTLLEIHTVNGEELEEKILFDFHRASKSVGKPKPGDDFDYFVHEYGSFDGDVVLARQFGMGTDVTASDGFYYRPEITIHKSLK